VASEHFGVAVQAIRRHPLFAPLAFRAEIVRQEDNLCPPDGWAVLGRGSIHAHPTRRGAPEEWIYVLAHCLLHLGFGHYQERPDRREWNTACDCVVAKFLADLKLGRRPAGVELPAGWPALDEDRLYRSFVAEGIPEEFRRLGVAGPTTPDLLIEPVPPVAR